MKLTGKNSIILLVDEIAKIEDEGLRDKVITLLGNIQDVSRFTNILISTLDYFILEKAESNRDVKYIQFKPLFDLFNIIELHDNLKNYHNIKLNLIELSLVPRISAKLYREISNFD
jgi:hypothetical protein